MESFIVKGDEGQWAEALLNRKNGDPEEGGIVQIKVNSNTNNSKRRQGKVDLNDEVANKKRRKTDKMKHEKKSREKR
jgi:hypothetical protein